MDALPWILFAVAVLGAAFFAVQWNGLRQVKAPASNAPDLTAKLDAARAELTAAKEETQRKQKLLDEAREEAKKKLRRDGKKQEREEEAQKASGPDARDIEIAGLKKGLASLESQLNTAKRDVEQASEDLERMKGDAGRESEGAVRSRDEAKSKSASLAEENIALKRTLEELRASKKKEAAERPEVPGTALDLKSLPSEAVQELARYFRKGEEFERMYAVAQGQLQLAQDRFMELQRRYFAVCRELALAAGVTAGSDDEAKKTAEGVVAGTDQVARAAGQPGQPGQAQVAGAPGEGQKKRRRRRRRRKPGAPGAPGEAAAAGAEGGGAEGA
ncbi:MAG TPA: hypothetical protein VGO62_02840, partial [Myxococcota bacterium]